MTEVNYYAQPITTVTAMLLISIMIIPLIVSRESHSSDVNGDFIIERGN